MVTMPGMIELLIYIAIIGLVACVLIQLVPMPSAVRTALVAVAILLILLVVLRGLGGIDIAGAAEQTQAALWSGSLVPPWDETAPAGPPSSWPSIGAC
jgi:hypothetical protein